MPRNLATALCATVALLTVGAAATSAVADALPSEATSTRVITVPRDKSLSFRLEQPAVKIVVAQPDIAEVVATTDRSFYVRGLELGATNLLVYGPGGRLLEVIDVRVGADAKILEHDLAQALPKEHIQVETFGEGVLLRGEVSNPGAAIKAKAIAESFAPDGVTSMLRINGSQVMLEVRIMEANRSAANDLGLSATISNGSFNFSFGDGLIGSSTPTGVLHLTGGAGHTKIDAQIAALEAKGIIHTLARPNLVAMSGEKATFLAGGEFPFPVPSGLNQVTIEFRPYGVKLNFTPTVQDDGKVRLVVEPEVSQLDNANTLRLNGVTVPALTVRRTSTTVELTDGASLAIGGMFQHEYTNAVQQVPALGDIPILGALFRSSHWQRNETELLIVVTPHVVTQGDFDSAKNRIIAGPEPSAADLLLNGDAHDKPLLRDPRGDMDPRGSGSAAPELRGAIVPAVPASGK